MAAVIFREKIYILPADLMAERWDGRRLKLQEVKAISGIGEIRYVEKFAEEFHHWAAKDQAAL